MKTIEVASDFYYDLSSLKSEILDFKIFKKDSKNLNLEILTSNFDISSMDFSLYPMVYEEYALLFTGALFAKECKANIVKKNGKKLKKDFKIALNDEYSVFTMLLKIFYPKAKIILKSENEIEKAIIENEVHAGLILDDKFSDELCIENTILEIWHNLNKYNLPLPLRCFVARRSLPLTDAIYAQESLSKALNDSKFYENDTNKKAVEFLFKLGYDYRFYPQKINICDNLVPHQYLDYRFS